LVYSRLYSAAGVTHLLFLTLLAVIAGLALLVRPWSGVISLTVILIVCFALVGAAKLTYPLECSRYLSSYRGWIRTSVPLEMHVCASLAKIARRAKSMHADGGSVASREHGWDGAKPFWR
jgi:hypothetical protein